VVDGALAPEATLVLVSRYKFQEKKFGLMTKTRKISLIIYVKAGRPRADAGGKMAERNKISINNFNIRRTLWVKNRNGDYMRGLRP